MKLSFIVKTNLRHFIRWEQKKRLEKEGEWINKSNDSCRSSNTNLHYESDSESVDMDELEDWAFGKCRGDSSDVSKEEVSKGEGYLLMVVREWKG